MIKPDPDASEQETSPATGERTWERTGGHFASDAVGPTAKLARDLVEV